MFFKKIFFKEVTIPKTCLFKSQIKKKLPTTLTAMRVKNFCTLLISNLFFKQFIEQTSSIKYYT